MPLRAPEVALDGCGPWLHDTRPVALGVVGPWRLMLWHHVVRGGPPASGPGELQKRPVVAGCRGCTGRRPGGGGGPSPTAPHQREASPWREYRGGLQRPHEVLRVWAP